MKKTILTFILTSIAILTFAQQATLRVNGSSAVAVKPTLTTINLSIESTSETYVGSLNNLTNRINLMAQSLKKTGFKEEEILTSKFNVHAGRIRIKDTWHDSGFVATQTVIISFPQSTDRLIEVLNAVTNSGARPAINLSFDLDDERKASVKNELIKQAVKDARGKADLLAEAAGYKVVGIREIQYGQANMGPGPLYGRMESMTFSKAADIQISNFNVSDLSFSDGVLVTYTIDTAK